MEILQKQKPMKTLKAMRDRKNWALVQADLLYKGQVREKYSVCPICLEWHRLLDKNDKK